MPNVLVSRVTAAVFTAAALCLTSSRVVAQDADTLSRKTALLRFLAEASERNRLPDSLMSYRSKVETEIAILLKPSSRWPAISPGTGPATTSSGSVVTGPSS
jgi:hypothetical protein